MIALGAILLTWLILGDTSPFNDYFLWHVGIPNFWRLLNAAPFIAGAMIVGNRGGPDAAVLTILQFIQWFVVGFLLSIVLSKVFRRA